MTAVDNTAAPSPLDRKLFMAGPAQSVQPLDIAVPADAFDAYRARADDPAYEDYHFEYWANRYLGIRVHDHDGQERLALPFLKIEVYRFCIVGNGAIFAERIPIGPHIRAARQLDADRLVLLTDNNEPVFLTENPNGAATAFLAAYLEQNTLPAHTRGRLKANMDTCLTCHSLDPDVNDFAPRLAANVGAPRGKRPFPSYSPTLRAEEVAGNRPVRASRD